MPTEALNRFIDQIASWSRQAIDQGRSPFRKVETGFPLLTTQGELLAPLVFWINRDSFMAGGLMLFPDRGDSTALQTGMRMAEALGLQHFVTWTEQQIQVWDCRDCQVGLNVAFPLQETRCNQVTAFKQLLDTTLDKLKYLSVMTSPAPEQLSASYLANLCRTAIHDTLPLLATEKRITRDDSDTADTPWALAKGYQTVIRLLTLTTLDLLPTSVQPEGLEKALRFYLPAAPKILCERLQFSGSSIPLPGEASVRYHHLLRRLQQLGMQKTARRTCNSLNLLLTHDGARLTGNAQPCHGTEPTALPDLTVNLATPPMASPATIEIAPQAILAAKALIRHLEGWDHPSLQHPELFTLQLPQLPTGIFGVLFQQKRPDRRQRQTYETSLRFSWPARRLSVAPSAPLWLFECLHLLGLCQPGGNLQLTVPDSWLRESWGDTLWELLCQEFTLLRLEHEADQVTNLTLNRNQQPDRQSILNGAASHTWKWSDLKRHSRHYLLACLYFPEDWLRLLESGTLRSYTNPRQPGRYPKALHFFYHHPPGRSLAELFGLTTTQQPTEQLAEQIASLGIPAPAEDALERLENLLVDDNSSAPVADDTLTVRLARLGDDFTRLAQPAFDRNRVEHSGSKPSRLPASLAGELSRDIFIDGIPLFPEHYLYDYYRPRLQRYSWQGQLTYGQAFFDLIVLQDTSGRRFEVTGEAGGAALWLAAKADRNVIDLPLDSDLCETILARYLNDLWQLRQNLVRKVRERLTHPRQADNLVRRLWQEQPLPDWESVEKVMTLFPQQFSVE